MRTDLEEFIISLIEDKGPLKGTEMAVEIVTNRHNTNPAEITEALDRLVNDEAIIEVEYVLPSMDYRIKSMFFPKNTKINAVVVR